MKSLPRLFAIVCVPLFVLALFAGCSGPITTTTKTLSSIAVTPASPAHLKVGTTQQFTATGTFSDGSTSDITSTVTWTSGTTATATISTAGLATAVAQGTTQITASMTGATSPGVTLTVISLTSIAVTPAAPAHLKIGATQQFTATATFSDASTSDITSTVTWTSGTTATATISAAGLATAVAQGTTQITASLSGVTSPGVTLTIISLTSLAITPNPASVAVGATLQFTATGTFSDASTANLTSQVTWNSATTSVATINAAGLATGVSTGGSNITATLGTVVSPIVVLAVGGAVVPVSLKITPANPTIITGQTEDFTAVELLSDGSTQATTGTVTWTSGTTATASIVSTAGIAIGVTSGTSKITATEGTLTGNTTLTVAAAVPRFVYTIGPNDGVTSGYAINASAGTLAPLPSVHIDLDPIQLVFEPSGQFAYAPAAGANAVRTFVVDPVSGTLSTSGFPDAPIPSFVSGTTSITQSVVDPTGRYLYVLDGGTGSVNAFSIDTSNTATKGTLTPSASSPTISAGGAGATGIVVDPLGRFVYVANSTANSIVGYSIGSDGGLTLLASIGPGPFTSLNGPQFLGIDPLGQFLFVPSNPGTGGSVSAFAIAADGKLTFVNAVTTNISGPFQAVVDPAGKFAFVSNSGDGTIAVMPIGSGGTLGAATTTATGVGAGRFPEGLAIDASGSLLSVANNGDNSVALFGLANGVLTPKFVSETRVIPQYASFYSGTSAPVIGPSSVFAANSGSGNISGFTAVNTTGVLSAGSGSPTVGIVGNTFLTADSTGNFLLNSSPGNKQFEGFSVTPSTAALAAFTGAPFSLSTSTDAPSEIAIEPSSRFFFVADTTGNVVEPFSLTNPPVTIGATSSLTSVNTVVADPQGTLLYALGTNVINPILVSGFNGNLAPSGATVTPSGTWTSGAIDPSGHWLVTLDSAGTTLQSFQITPIQVSGTDGDLTATAAVPTTGVTAPSSVVFDPQGRFVFVADATNGTVTAFAFNGATGAVTTTGKQTTVSATGTGKVSIDGSGTYLYAAVAGNGTTVASGVGAYKINSDGSLTAVAGSPFATGAGTSGTSGVAVTTSVQ